MNALLCPVHGLERGKEHRGIYGRKPLVAEDRSQLQRRAPDPSKGIPSWGIPSWGIRSQRIRSQGAQSQGILLPDALPSGCRPPQSSTALRSTISGDPTSGDPISGDPISRDPISGDPISGDPSPRLPPTTVIYGTADWMWSPAVEDAVHELGCTLHVIEGGKHHLYLDRPQEFRALVEKALLQEAG